MVRAEEEEASSTPGCTVGGWLRSGGRVVVVEIQYTVVVVQGGGTSACYSD